MLAAITAEGCEVVVIGGLAVGAYGRTMGESVLSADLDVLANRDTLDAVVSLARQHGAQVRKVPQARAIPTAFLEWDGKEVNVLLSAIDLPSPDVAARTARIFRLRERPDVPILVADPYDLLANKMRVNREKDRPHVEVLLRFLHEEVVSAFHADVAPRERLGPAKRLLKAAKWRLLPADLAARLLPLCRTSVDFRFLMNHVPQAAQAQQLIDLAPPEFAAELTDIRKHRRFRF